MKTLSVSHAKAVSHKLYIVLGALSLLLLPVVARAQNEGLRQMAGRVLDAAREREWRDFDRRAGDRGEYSRRELERWCRDNWWSSRCGGGRYDRRDERRGDWCRDRNRDDRCDGARSERRGRGRGPWRDDRDGWTPPGRRGRR